MDWDEYPRYAKEIADWGAEYYRTLRDRPVRAQTLPGEVAQKIALNPPEKAESMDEIMADFHQIIMPGMTHWQHPSFFAYFPANSSPPSAVAEMIVNTMASQCMLWQTSPAATELEEMMVDWLRQALALPEGFKGVIQDSASSATLSAVLTMRERATGWSGNREGLADKRKLRIYCSNQVHSSIDRACWVAGIGQENLVKITTEGNNFGVNIAGLKQAIEVDREKGYVPAGIIAVTGGTGIGAWDDLEAVGKIAQSEDLYTHLDAAWAGSAMICPEHRDKFWRGAETFDSIVFNPHKWLGAQFDCSIQFLKDPSAQLSTLKIEPEYLKTTEQSVTNFSEWTIPLGRRFRSLKLWFVLRAYGLEGLRERIRNHVTWANEVCERIRKLEEFEIVTEPILSLFSFRCVDDDAKQQELLDAINHDGRIYLTQGLHQGRKMIRFQVGQFATTRDDVLNACDVINEIWKEIR